MHGAIEQVFRRQKAQLVAALTRMLRDVHRAEEIAQDALVSALETWPFSGIPENPGAWLMLTARRGALDELRHRKRANEKQEALGWHVTLTTKEFLLAEDSPEQIADDQLRLIFTCCHPTLSREAQVALTLRLLGGLSTEEIASAFLSSEPTIAQRIVRAKKAVSGLDYESPAISEIDERLPAVLEVLYLIFNEGYAASRGDALIRKELCDEAIRLATLLTTLLPDEGEALGLLALMEVQASRREARVDEAGELVLLPDQDRSRWDRAAIARAHDLLLRARRGPPGPYRLQAEIALLYATSDSFASTNFAAIAILYEALSAIAPSPIVDLNRAVAIGLAEGPEAGLRALDALSAPALRDYHLYPAARADFLRRLGRTAHAAAAYREAIARVGNDRERAFLERRLTETLRGLT